MENGDFDERDVERDGALDLACLAADLTAAIDGQPFRPTSQAGRRGSERALTASQTARTLRFALSEFADGRCRTKSGGSKLAGYIEAAGARARLTREQIGQRRFQLVFQPVVTLANRRVHHVEALLRPTAMPGHAASLLEFVTFSEAIGLAEELDSAVLEQTVAALDRAPDVAIAVNVSGLSLQSRSFRHRLMALGLIHPGRLLVELTETAQIDDVPMVAGTLERLRSIGVPVCIDDFGAGGAAFRYLRDFKADYVKIDGDFVRRAVEDERDRGFVQSMVDLARSVGAEVIAEMIETEEEAALMRQMGVKLGQGWLFGRGGPLPAARLSATG